MSQIVWNKYANTHVIELNFKIGGFHSVPRSNSNSNSNWNSYTYRWTQPWKDMEGTELELELELELEQLEVNPVDA